MRTVSIVARMLMGIIFLFFGSNLLFHFLPNPPLPPGPFNSFASALAESHYIYAVGFFQVVPGILLLVNRYIPLALATLAAIIVNIDLTHILMAPSGLPMAAVVTILWILVFLPVRSAFYPLFQQRVQV